jgi:hypothetical protein
MTVPAHDSDAQRLVAYVRVHIPTLPDWRGGWKSEADTALIDAVFSTRSHYESTVLPLVKKWQGWEDRPHAGTLAALALGNRADIVNTIPNGQYVPGGSKRGCLKVDAAIDIAQRLYPTMNTPDEIRKAAAADTGALRRNIQETFGIGPAVSAYFLMLLGVQGVKADTMVTSFVERAVDGGHMSTIQIEAVVKEAAVLMGVKPIALDHAIWRSESTKRRTARRRKPGK